MFCFIASFITTVISILRLSVFKGRFHLIIQDGYRIFEYITLLRWSLKRHNHIHLKTISEEKNECIKERHNDLKSFYTQFFLQVYSITEKVFYNITKLFVYKEDLVCHVFVGSCRLTILLCFSSKFEVIINNRYLILLLLPWLN